MKLEIDRERWLCGDGDGLLLDDHGNMCCLGFYSNVCGVADKDMLDWTSPSELFMDREKPKAEMVNFKDLVRLVPRNPGNSAIDTQLCRELMTINDSVNYDNITREIMIRDSFKTIAIEVVYVGEYPE